MEDKQSISKIIFQSPDPSEPKIHPHSLITEEGVKKALEAQHGQSAKLKSWSIQDFTSKGDNYASVVTSVSVAYLKDYKKLWTSFIVKLNPCAGIMSHTAFISFKTEAMFYRDFIPEFNRILNTAGQPQLKMPKCLYTNLEFKKEIIYLEDLRDDNFKMADRKKGFDVPHLNLVLHELARIHAASMLFKGCRTRKNLEDEYPYLKEMIFSGYFMPQDNMEQWGQSLTENSAAMIESIEGYKDIAAEIKNIKFFDKIREELKKSPENMEVICHGDCWTNNVLFKYDEHGCPKDIRVLDVQMTRVASLGTDLNYLMHNSVTGPMRKKYLHVFLETYYSSFNNVLAGVNYRPLFSKEELVKEYKDRRMFGLLTGLMVIPIMLSETDEVIDYTELEMENAEEFMMEQKKTLLKQMKTNPYIRPRFLDMIDEMVEDGVIKVNKDL